MLNRANDSTPETPATANHSAGEGPLEWTNEKAPHVKVLKRETDRILLRQIASCGVKFVSELFT